MLKHKTRPGQRQRTASLRGRAGLTLRAQLEPESIRLGAFTSARNSDSGIVDLGQEFGHRSPGMLGLASSRRVLLARARIDPDSV